MFLFLDVRGDDSAKENSRPASNTIPSPLDPSSKRPLNPLLLKRPSYPSSEPSVDSSAPLEVSCSECTNWSGNTVGAYMFHLNTVHKMKFQVSYTH